MDVLGVMVALMMIIFIMLYASSKSFRNFSNDAITGIIQLLIFLCSGGQHQAQPKIVSTKPAAPKAKESAQGPTRTRSAKLPPLVIPDYSENDLASWGQWLKEHPDVHITNRR